VLVVKIKKMKKAIFVILVSLVICSCFNERRNRSIGAINQEAVKED